MTMEITRIETEQNPMGLWNAYVIQGGRTVAAGRGCTRHEAIEKAKRARADYVAIAEGGPEMTLPAAEEQERALMHGAISLRFHARDPGMDEQELLKMAATLDAMREVILRRANILLELQASVNEARRMLGMSPIPAAGESSNG
jgi:L-ascorbate metabolism protein UlaG (beta-lactamase superfamily)